MPGRPLVLDELPDRVLSRPLAALLVRLLAPTPITANQVTLLSALWGIGAGVALGLGEGVACAALIAAMLVFDCADGQLARLRGGGGVWGRVVDGLGDYATGIALHVGLIAVLLAREGSAAAAAWGIGSGVGMAWCSYLMDKAKRRYRGDTDDLEAVRREQEAAHGLKRVLLGTFTPYASQIAGGDAIPDRDAYQARLRPVMALWLWVGPTMHVSALAVLAALDRPLLYAWIACGPFNLLALVLVGLQRWAEHRAPPVVAAGGSTT
jgi:phosphatidylglycerophosphate synthase